MAVVSPLGDVGCNRLIGHNESAACLGDLAHLAVEVFYRACTVLAHHQTTDAVVGGVAAAIVILDIVFGMGGIADTRQTMVVVCVGYHLSFLSHVRRLLCQDIAKRVGGERRDASCRVVHLRAAVSHVVNRCGDGKTPDTFKQDNMVCNIMSHAQS